MTAKGRNVAYWITTGMIVFFIGGGGASQVWQYARNPHGVVPVLEYPLYFFLILGIWKVLGAIAIVVPGYARLKEWAYAGIFFDLTGAALSCAFVHGYGAYGFHIIAPLVLTAVLMASWALRPAGRVLGRIGGVRA